MPTHTIVLSISMKLNTKGLLICQKIFTYTLYKTIIRKYWDKLDDKLKKDDSIKMFKKGTPAKTVSQEFRKASNKFAKEYLEKVSTRTKSIGIF